MTNIEELIDEIYRLHGYTVGRNDFKKLIDVFLESNVCIPKGGVLQANIGGKWEAIVEVNNIDNFRVKPSDPIYEWQWYWVEFGIATIANNGKFMTDDEANIDTPIWYKLEQTKKERK